MYAALIHPRAPQFAMHKGRRVCGAVGGVVEILMPPINALNVTLIAISRSPFERPRTARRSTLFVVHIRVVSASAAGDAKHAYVSRECKRAAVPRRAAPRASVVTITFRSYYNELSPMMKYRGNE